MLDTKRINSKYLQPYRVFSHDVTAAILVSQNNETAAILVSQTNPVGVELFSYANAFFCSNKFAQILATWVKTLYWPLQQTSEHTKPQSHKDTYAQTTDI